MRILRCLTLYMALAVGANTAAAADADLLQGLRDGDMKKLNFHSAPEPVPATAFQLADGAGEGTLADYRGQYVLLNFWATWCAPCRVEMPTLSALQAEFGGEAFQVVTIATGRNAPAGISAFFEENGIDNLPRHQDPRQALAREMGILGLPITVLIDPEGREIARLMGDADWHSDSARAIVRSLIDSAANG